MFAIESNIFALGDFESPTPADSEDPEIHNALNSARVFLADAKQFALLSIYEQRIHRNLKKPPDQLNELPGYPQTYGARPLSQDSSRDPNPNPVNTTGLPLENGFGFANDPFHPKIAAASV